MKTIKQTLHLIFSTLITLAVERWVRKGDKMNTQEINEAIKTVDSNQISDGYHTFGELYDHRITLFIVLMHTLNNSDYFELSVWKSKKHSDGSVWDGWFIAGIGTKKGEQITYHLPIDRWDELKGIYTRPKAPEWDGHTPKDVLERLRKLI